MITRHHVAPCKNSATKYASVRDGVGGACLDYVPNPILEFHSDRRQPLPLVPPCPLSDSPNHAFSFLLLSSS